MARLVTSNALSCRLASSVLVGVSGLAVTATSGLMNKKKKAASRTFASVAVILAATGLAFSCVDVMSGGAGGRAHKLCSSPTVCWVSANLKFN